MDETKYATSYHNNIQKGSLDQIVAAYLESVHGTEENMKLLRSNTPYVYNKKNQVKLFHHFMCSHSVQVWCRSAQPSM